MSYYFLSKAMPETPELPAGYIMGVIDEFNPAPEGATIVDSLAEVDALAKASDKKSEALIQAMIEGLAPSEPEDPVRADVFKLTQLQFVKKYRVKDAVKLAKALGVKHTGREADIVARIYEALDR